MSWVGIPIKIVYIAVIIVDNTLKINVLRFRGYIFTIIFSDRSMISFGRGEINRNKTFLEYPRSITAGTLLVK